jgi:hypothetical protein
VVEMDEMHTYVGTKKTIAGYGLLSVDMGNGPSTAKWVPATPTPGESSGAQSKAMA